MIDWDTFKLQLQSNPGKLLKSVLLLAGCFLAIWIIVVLQSPSATRTGSPQRAGRLDSLRTADNRTQPLQRSSAEEEGMSGTGSLLPITLFLVVIVGIVWLWVRSRNKTAKEPSPPLFTTIGSQQLPGGQQIIVIHINDEYWVMSASGPQSKMELLHRYAADEWNGPFTAPEKKAWKQTFLETLQQPSSDKKDVRS